MRSLTTNCRNGVFLLLVSLSISASAQNTGYINRSATTLTGRQILDPNQDGYTSATTSGFAGDDVANSEIHYKSVPSFSAEPFGDLRRGPAHLYSDFVPDVNSIGYYAFNDGTNLLFRMRMGSIMSGSKGYSVMLDTDGKFGATGASADPNYVAATTATNGNPGFEIEIVLETNFRIAIYNVDGSSTATLVKAYTNWQDMSQVSIAGTFDNGDPDFFIDFYVPLADLTAAPFNLTPTTALRMSATTVMAPAAAIGGPKSDIYGLNDAGYGSTNNEYEAFITAQPAFTLNSITSVGVGFGSICTAAPVVNTSLNVGNANITGTWVMSSLSGAAATTNITVYKNGTAIGSVLNVASGTTWTLNNITLSDGDLISAKAQSSGESMCLVSNTVKVSSCTSANRPATPALDCLTTSKGISGTNLSTGWTVHVDNLTTAANYNSVTNISTAAFGTPTGTSPNIVWTFSGGCTSGSPLTGGSYKVYYTNNVTGCASTPVYVCSAGNGNGAIGGALGVPTITAPASGIFTTATTSISGTTDANASLFLYVDGAVAQSVKASTTGAFTFSNLNFSAGNEVYIVAELNTGDIKTSKCAAQTNKQIVSCFTQPPIITADNNNQTTVGAAITGYSSEPAGTIIKVYTSANVLVATTTVQPNGSWSTANAGTTASAYNATTATTYYATAQNGTCGISASSANVAAATTTAATRCGTITEPVSAGATSVSGTITGAVAGTAVNLYLDGTKIGTTNTSTTAWTINVASASLYASGTLSIGIQETGKQEVVCPYISVIGCAAPPTAPVVSPTNFNISQNQSVTYKISNAVTGYFYGVADASTGQSVATGMWANTNGELSITTVPFNDPGTHDVVIKATTLSGVTVCVSSPTTTNVAVQSLALPVTFLNFNVVKNASGLLLTWNVANEQNVLLYEIEKSTDCRTFTTIGTMAYQPTSLNTNRYSFSDRSTTSGQECFRIKQIDNDGKFHYSNIVRVNNFGFVPATLAPNPTTDQLTINLTSSLREKATIQLVNITGSVVLETSALLLPGSNKINLNGLQKFTRGQYLLNIIKATPEHFKVVLQ